MNEPSPCGQVFTQSCSTPCTECLPSISLAEALARYRREAVPGICDTGRYRCRFFTWGVGPPLLFIHGIADTSGAYVLPIALLSSSFRCIAYDLPAGGQDGADLKRYTHLDLIEDLWALLDHVGAKQSYVFASAFGSMVALAAMKARPERLPRAILQAGMARKPLTTTERFRAWLMNHMPGTMGALPLRRWLLHRLHHGPFAEHPPENWEHFISCRGTTPLHAVGRLARMLHHIDLRPLLGDTRQPVLVVSGSLDPVVREELTQELLDGLPSAGRVILQGCGHFPNFTHPAALAQLIRAFLTLPPPVTQAINSMEVKRMDG
jgi:pimeloyl-ACP methyl ester carboxylesterase